MDEHLIEFAFPLKQTSLESVTRKTFVMGISQLCTSGPLVDRWQHAALR